MQSDVPTLLATAVASAVGTAVAGAIGYSFAVAKFRRERAFDRRLEWYERMLRTLVNFSLELEVAATIAEQAAARAAGGAADWHPVQMAHLEFIRVSAEVYLYGTDGAVALIRRGEAAVQRVADETDAFDSAAEYLGTVWALARLLKRVGHLIATDARAHLALGSQARVHVVRRK